MDNIFEAFEAYVSKYKKDPCCVADLLEFTSESLSLTIRDMTDEGFLLYLEGKSAK